MNEMSLQNAKIEKIKKTSKVVITVTNVIKTIAIVCSVICLLMGILAIAFNGSLDVIMDISNEQGVYEMEEMMMQANQFTAIVGRSLNEGHFGYIMGAYLMVMGVFLIGVAVLYHFVGSVFRTFSESYSPFVPEVVKKLKVTFVLIALPSFSSGVGVGAIVSLALWCVFHVFEYGCELQREADETL